MSINHSSDNVVNGGIPHINVTNETIDVSEYIESVFYDKVCFKDNDGLSLSEHGRWLGILHRKGRLICYHILTQTWKVISRSMVQQVTNIELSTDEVKETFAMFDT